jgi:hypothetical protein
MRSARPAVAHWHMSRPPLSNEAGRSGFRQAGPRCGIRVAQHADGPQQRSCGWHALEGEGCQKGRCPAPHAGIVLAQQLVGIKLLRTCQGRGFGNAGAEAIPRDHRRNRVKGILLALARRNQGGADARVQANLVIDGTAVGLESRACRPSTLRNIVPTSRSNRSMAWSVRSAIRSSVMATRVA